MSTDSKRARGGRFTSAAIRPHSLLSFLSKRTPARATMKLLRASALGVLLLLAAIIPSPLRAQSTDAPNTRTIDGVAVTEVTCAPDVYDCDNGEFIAYLEDDAPETAQCAPYNNHFVNPDTLKWVVGCAAVVAMLMARAFYADE